MSDRTWVAIFCFTGAALILYVITHPRRFGHGYIKFWADLFGLSVSFGILIAIILAGALIAAGISVLLFFRSSK